MRFFLLCLPLYQNGLLAGIRPEYLPTRYSSNGTISPLLPCTVILCLVALYFLVKCSAQVTHTCVTRPISNIDGQLSFKRYVVHGSFITSFVNHPPPYMLATTLKSHLAYCYSHCNQCDVIYHHHCAASLLPYSQLGLNNHARNRISQLYNF